MPNSRVLVHTIQQSKRQVHTLSPLSTPCRECRTWHVTIMALLFDEREEPGLPVIVLTERNYVEWAQQIRAWIMMIGHTARMQHLEPLAGTPYPPVFVDDVDGTKLENWLDKDSFIAGNILLTLSSMQHHYVEHTDSAAVIWRKLQSAHQHQRVNT